MRLAVLEARPWQRLLCKSDTLASETLRYRDLFELAPDPCMVTDMSGNIREANRATAQLLSAPQGFLARKPVAMFVEPAARRDFRLALAGVSLGAAPPADWRTTLRWKDHERRVGISVRALGAPPGAPRRLYWLVRPL